MNFFNWIEPGYDFSKRDRSFEEVLGYTKDFFEEQLTKEKMSAHINDLLALELHPILRLAPLELKNLCIHAGAKFSEKNTTAIFSNMSAVRMPDSYVPYIERFGVFTNTPKLELCLCSFEDKLSFAFTSRYDTVNIERNFYRLLKEQGITAEKVEPEFPKPQMPSEQEMKVYKVYSFLCLVLATAMVVTDLNFHPRIRWTWFTAGGVATMWIASSIGFFKRYNLLKNVMWQLLIGSIICFIWDGFTGWHGWSADLALQMMEDIKCPNCGAEDTVDLEDYVYSESSDERENGMGPDFVRYFDSEQSYECPDCGKIICISGWKREYPMGAFDSEDVDVALVEEND